MKNQLLPFLLVVPILFVIGTVGYMLIENWPLADALYMTAITLGTVGFSEVHPLSDTGRIFTVALIISGVGTVAYGFTQITEFLLTARTSQQLRKRRMMKAIKQLEKHVIICGYGRVGHSAAQGLIDGRRKVVIIDQRENLLELAEEKNLIFVEGDATKDETLREAGIERASSLLVCTGDDSINLFIVLSARALNPKLYIVARTLDAANEEKMRRAGADRVVSPFRIGGKHMANIIIRPHVTDFFDVVTFGGMELWLEELIIHDNSPLVNQTVGQANIRNRTGVTLVAVLRREGVGTITPDADTIFKPGDELIVLGTRDQLATMEELTGDKSLHSMRLKHE